MYHSYKVMSGALGVKKPQEAQKGKSPFCHEGSQRQEG